jgi:hypothetical protein
LTQELWGAAECKHADEKRGKFFPCVVEVGGRFGEPATELFKELVHAVSQQTHMSKSLSSIWKRRLVVTLKRVNIQQQRLQAAKMGVIPRVELEEEDVVDMEDFEYVRM